MNPFTTLFAVLLWMALKLQEQIGLAVLMIIILQTAMLAETSRLEIDSHEPNSLRELKRLANEEATLTLTHIDGKNWSAESDGKSPVVSPNKPDLTFTIDGSKEAFPAGTHTAWPSFTIEDESGEFGLSSKVLAAWNKETRGEEMSTAALEADAAVKAYASQILNSLKNGDKDVYIAPSSQPDAMLGKAWHTARSSLVNLASKAEDPAAPSAIKTLLSSAELLEPQGAAWGLQRVTLKSSFAICEAASGVAEVLKDGNREGVCSRISRGYLITSAHVVSDAASLPSRLTVRFHILLEGKFLKVTVPVKQVHLRPEWHPKILTSNKSGNNDLLPTLDIAFLEMDLENLATNQETLLNLAKPIRIAKDPVTAESMRRQKQYFNISYDPRQITLSGPQIQFRCQILCPSVLYSDSDQGIVFEELFLRCLSRNIGALRSSDQNPAPKLCGGPLKSFFPITYFPQKSAPAVRYHSRSVTGVDRMVIGYEVSTYKGDSGSPLLEYIESEDAVAIVGIHMAADNSETPTPFGSDRMAYAAPTALISSDDLNRFAN
jgi:hypothetical protein